MQSALKDLKKKQFKQKLKCDMEHVSSFLKAHQDKKAI